MLGTWKNEAAMALTKETVPQFLPKCLTPYKSPTKAGTTLICVPTAANRATNDPFTPTGPTWVAVAMGRPPMKTHGTDCVGGYVGVHFSHVFSDFFSVADIFTQKGNRNGCQKLPGWAFSNLFT